MTRMKNRWIMEVSNKENMEMEAISTCKVYRKKTMNGKQVRIRRWEGT